MVMAVCCAVYLAQCLAFLTSLSSALSMCDTPVISSGNYSTGKYEMDSLNLDCSASSADNIFWFYRPPGNDSEWEPYKFSWCSELSPKTCHLDDNDKRLRIGSVSMEMNDAQFICVASCSTTLRNATAFIYLGVQECYTKTPEVMPGQNVSASLAQEATISCQAQMGPCYQLTYPNYVWVDEDNQRFVTNENYTVNITLDGQGSLVTTLTIHEVKQEDFKSYTCILIDDHFIQGSERTTIYLLQTESVIINSEAHGLVVKIVVPCVVVFLLMVLFIAIIIYNCFRWRLKYMYKIKWSKRKSGGAQYDAIVWYDDNHNKEARTLIDTLEAKHYRIVTPEEGPSGYEMKSLQSLIENSACVIFLRGEDDKTMTVLRQAQEKQTVFVIDATDPSEDRNKAMAGFIRLRWPVKKGQATRNIFAKIRKDEFYYRLRSGLPKPNSVPDKSETIPMKPNVEQQI
ncbi:uncharacterized protein LOC111131853 isoform X1 [Crassostrea virginica]